MNNMFLTIMALGCVSSVSFALRVTEKIPMRDGVLLHTDIDFPPFFPAGKKAPAIIERSPYGDDQEELIALVFAEILGYVAIRQDVRGTGQSGGSFGIWHDSVNDTYDTLEWVANQTWTNGEVFATGVSADGIDSLMTMSHPHPSLRAQVIIFASSSAWPTFYPGGAYREALIDGWLSKTVKSEAKQLIPYVHSQEAPSLEWWRTVNGSLWFQNIAWPSVHWAGWYDIFLSGHMDAFRGYQSLSSLPGQAKLVIDPCGHCQDAATLFPSNAVLGRAALPLLMALDLLADDSITNRSWPNVAEDVRNVTFYVMGADEVGARGGYWTTLDDFPEPTPTRFYLGADGGLTPAPPSGAAAGTRSYVYEPSNPVITIGGNNLEIKCGPLDQRPIEKAARQDVLLFTTAPLSAPLAITGGVDATIFVSTNVLDTDVVVKLIDVYPAIDPADPFLSGESVLVQDGISRLKWRNWRTDTAEALLSGDPAEVYTTTVSLWNTSYVFAAGHRIRVHVTSSNFPRFYPNPNTGSSFDSRNVTAATTIHFDGAKASSYLTLPVVPLSALPPFPIEEALAAAAERHGDKWRALMSAGGGDGETDLTAWLSKRAETAVTSSRKRMEL